MYEQFEYIPKYQLLINDVFWYLDIKWNPSTSLWEYSNLSVFELILWIDCFHSIMYVVVVRESHICKHTLWELSIYPSLLSSIPLCFSYNCYVRIFPTVSKNCRFHKCRGAKLFSEVVGACTLFVSSWNFVVTYCMKEDRGPKRQLAFVIHTCIMYSAAWGPNLCFLCTWFLFW